MKKTDFNKINKDDLPAVVLAMLGIQNPPIKLNSKESLSGGGGTTNKDGWLLVAERIEELINLGKLKI